MNIQYQTCHTCNIVDVLNAAMDVMGKSYDELESMAFSEGIFPEGHKVSINVSKPDSDKTPLTNLIRDFVRKNSLGTLIIEEND